MMRTMLPLAVVAVLSVAPVDQGGWTAQPPLRVARIGLDVATVSGQILAIGGFDGDVMYNTVEARAAQGDGRWRPLEPMPTARANAAAATVAGIVYVAGGFTLDRTLDVVERFDLRTGGWQASPRLPEPAGAMGAAALNGRLYVAGGLVARPDGDVVSAAVYAFDPGSQRWARIAPMPTPRWRLRLVAAGGFLFAIGGLGADGQTLSTVERYDPRTNTWSAVRPMREARAVPGVTVAGGTIVVVGGIRFQPSTQLLRSTEVYDPQTGNWRVLDTLLPHGRASLVCAVASDGTVLAIGGASDATSPPSATAEVDALKVT